MIQTQRDISMWVRDVGVDSSALTGADIPADFKVDTKATPPRSIWVHPYEDEQYLKEHPEKRDSLKPPPPYEEDSRRHSWNGNASSSQAAASGSKSKDHDRGAFGKFKDKLIGTKEEREAKRKEEEKVRLCMPEMQLCP